jgi:S1-C subfamily serine protease
MSDVHQWINRYSAPIPSGQVISNVRPGEQIAKAISEIQDVISAMQGADKDNDASEIEAKVADLAAAVAELAAIVAAFTNNSSGTEDTGGSDYMVWQKQGGAAVWDFVRATA